MVLILRCLLSSSDRLIMALRNDFMYGTRMVHDLLEGTFSLKDHSYLVLQGILVQKIRSS